MGVERRLVGQAVDTSFTLRPMYAADVPAVLALDQAVKPSPWTAAGFADELTNELSFPMVLTTAVASSPATPNPEPDLCGYIVYWLVADELTVNTIVVALEWRGRGLGEYLLLAALQHGRAYGITLASLEVRVSNHPAQNLYRKYEFKTVGRRPRYYQDNREDALLMLAEQIDTPAYGQLLHERQQALQQLSNEKRTKAEG